LLLLKFHHAPLTAALAAQSVARGLTPGCDQACGLGTQASFVSSQT
jgi:hypothetical protein